MKKDLFLFIFFATLFVSCSNKQNDPTTPYQPGQEIEFSVVANGDGFSNHARYISGSYNSVGNFVNFSWNWGPGKSNNEEMIVEIVGNTDASKRELFTMTANNPTTGVATFKGNLPSNYTGSEQLRIIAGNITDIDNPNPPIPSVPCFSGIDENMMRLEDTIASVDEQIELKAVWSVFRLPILFDPTDNEGYPLTAYGSIEVHYHINKIVTRGNYNGSPFTFTYNVPADRNFDYTTTPGVEQSYNIYAQLITKPGTYSDLFFDVEFDLSQCSVVGWNLITSPVQSSTKTFDASGSSYTISKNKCFYTPLADCFYKFAQ